MLRGCRPPPVGRDRRERKRAGCPVRHPRLNRGINRECAIHNRTADVDNPQPDVETPVIPAGHTDLFR